MYSFWHLLYHHNVCTRFHHSWFLILQRKYPHSASHFWSSIASKSLQCSRTDWSIECLGTLLYPSIQFFSSPVILLSHEDQVWQLSLSLFDCIYRPRYIAFCMKSCRVKKKFAEITLVYTLLNKLTVLLFCYRLIRKILLSSKWCLLKESRIK